MRTKLATPQILVAMFMAVSAGGVVAQQSHERFLAGRFGELVDARAATVPGVVRMDHRPPGIGGQDIFVGSRWGRAFDGGAVFRGERIVLTTNTFPAACGLKIWTAIKQANNGNRLQQKTVRNNGSGTVALTANFDGQLVYTIQNRDSSASCAVATDLEITAAP